MYRTRILNVIVILIVMYCNVCEERERQMQRIPGLVYRENHNIGVFGEFDAVRIHVEILQEQVNHLLYDAILCNYEASIAQSTFYNTYTLCIL